MRQSILRKPESSTDAPVFAFQINSNELNVKPVSSNPFVFSTPKNITIHQIYHQNPFDSRQYSCFAMGVVLQ